MTAAGDIDLYRCPLAGTTLIEASAGTGKTYSLCALYLRHLLQAQRDVKQVLVVTFTNAAVAELRDRIRGRIVETLAALRGQAAASADPFVPTLLSALRAGGATDAQMARCLDVALQSFDQAAIHTIHVFCQRALQLAPFSAGAPLVLEMQTDIQPLRLAAAQDAWRRHVTGASAAELPPALAAHLADSKDGPERLEMLLAQRLAKPLAVPRWPPETDAPLDTALLQRFGELRAEAAALWGTERVAIESLLTREPRALDGSAYSTKVVPALCRDWETYFATGAVPRGKNYERFVKLGIETLALNTKPGRRTPEHPFFELAQQLLDTQVALEHARLRLLRTLLDDAEQLLHNAMRQQRLQSPDDLLRKLYHCLHGPDAAGWTRRLRTAYPVALIDEFQDTDPLQFEIFRAIFEHPDASLCMVGDPKQAIYSFRHADLPTYLRARDRATSRLALRENQRATPQLLAALNTLYTRNRAPFMQKGLDYVQVSASARPRGHYADSSGGHAALRVWLLPRTDDGGVMEMSAVARAACDATADEIARLLNGPEPARLNGEPLQPSDVAVLVRTRDQGRSVREALLARGLQSAELAQQGIYQSVDAADLAALLAGIWEPSREPLLRAALATTAAGFDAERLEALAADEAAWLTEVQRHVDYRDAWLAHGVGWLLRRVFAQSKLHGRMARRTDGERRLTNYLHLAELLQELEQDHPAPEALLRALAARRREATRDDAALLRLESDDQLVHIVTIHGAKGLEYPVVFCPFLWRHQEVRGSSALGRESRAKDGTQEIDYGPADPQTMEEHKRLRNIDAVAEELRLHYVALTRAIHRCYVVAGCYGRRTRGEKLTSSYSRRTALNWLVAGDRIEPAGWLNGPMEPDQIDAAWHQLARGASSTLALSPLPDWSRGGGAHGGALTLADRARNIVQRNPPAVPAAWRIGSYSALRRALAADAAPQDHDQRSTAPPSQERDVPTSAPPPAPPSTTPQLSLFDTADNDDEDMRRFPRGTAAGDCVHAVYEHIDYTDPSTWPGAIAAALRAHPLTPRDRNGAPLHDMLLRMLKDSLAVPLPGGLRLADVPPSRRLVELEFHLPSRGLVATQLNGALRDLGYAMPSLQFTDLHGYLHGYIDAVVEHSGRYYLVDWKSNDLGPEMRHYAPAAVQRAMDDHGYHLQHLLYSVALTRLLRLRVAGYAHAQHYGGVYYLYVRGLRPGWRDTDGTPCGVYFHRAPASTIARIDALLGQVHTAGAAP